jgi:hypothetical protein
VEWDIALPRIAKTFDKFIFPDNCGGLALKDVVPSYKGNFLAGFKKGKWVRNPT